jgi:hypothetical protein
MGWGHLKILFLRTMKPEKLNFTWKLSDMEQRQVDYIMGPRGSNGNEMHIIFLHGPRLLRWAMWPLGLLFALWSANSRGGDKSIILGYMTPASHLNIFSRSTTYERKFENIIEKNKIKGCICVTVFEEYMCSLIIITIMYQCVEYTLSMSFVFQILCISHQ